MSRPGDLRRELILAAAVVGVGLVLGAVLASVLALLYVWTHQEDKRWSVLK